MPTSDCPLERSLIPMHILSIYILEVEHFESGDLGYNHDVSSEASSSVVFFVIHIGPEVYGLGVSQLDMESNKSDTFVYYLSIIIFLRPCYGILPPV